MALTEKGQAIIREINEETSQRRQERLNSTAQCQEDGEIGEYYGVVGGPPQLDYVYQCPSGHLYKANGEPISQEQIPFIRIGF